MKKNMKKAIILSGILCLLLLCGCAGDDEPKETPTNTPAPSTELTAESLKDYPESPVSDFEFEEDADGNVSVLRYNGSDEIVVVPSAYEGKPVKFIGSIALANGCSAKAVKLPDSVEEIREGAFANNENLELVVLGSNTKKIEDIAFSNCLNLREVDLNEGLVTLEGGPFAFCPSLKSIYIPGTVTDIDILGLAVDSEEGRTIYGEKGSFIEKEVQEHGEEYHLTFEER